MIDVSNWGYILFDGKEVIAASFKDCFGPLGTRDSNFSGTYEEDNFEGEEEDDLDFKDIHLWGFES